MAKPLRLSVKLLTYDGFRPTNNPKDAIELDKKVEEGNVSEVARIQKSIPASTSQLAISLADASSTDYLIVSVDQILQIILNGDTANPITLNPKVAGYMTPAFMLRGTITSLAVTNSSSTTAGNIDIVSVKI